MAGNLRALTRNGPVTGSDTIKLDGYLFGGALLNCDLTNIGTITVWDGTDNSGDIIFYVSGKPGDRVFAPFKTESGHIYYTISGSNADAMLYEWVE